MCTQVVVPGLHQIIAIYILFTLYAKNPVIYVKIFLQELIKTKYVLARLLLLLLLFF